MKRNFIKILGFALTGVLALSLGSCGGNSASDSEKNSESESVNKADYPFYADEDSAAYEFTGNKFYNPYWLGNIMYNETVMLVDNGTSISGKLLHKPLKVLSVRDYTWQKEFKEGQDYTVTDNVINITSSSEIPYLTSENLLGDNLPEPYKLVDSIANVNTDAMKMASTIYTESSLIYGHQVSVTYVYDVRGLNKAVIPTFGAPKTKAKLSAGEPVKIVATGDSVMEGCSTSGHFNHEPYMGTFLELFKEGLKEKYTSEITVSNQAKGGMTSAWGSNDTQVNTMIAAKPDLLFVHFGVNDNGAGMSKNMYSDNIEYIVSKVKAALPDCEIVLIKCSTPNPVSYDSDVFKDYWTKLDNICENYSGVSSLDMYDLSLEILKTKKYMDITGNGINHLNDYSARLYSMAMLNSLIDYKND